MKVSPLIKHMISHAADEQTRYSIDGVYIQSSAKSEQVRLVATDGRRLAVFEYTDPDTIDSNIVVPRDVIAALKVRKTKKDGYLPFELVYETDGKWSLECAGIKTVFEVDDDIKFPPYNDVIPDHNNTKPGCAVLSVNPAYLSDAGKLAAYASTYHGSEMRGADWSHREANRPAKLSWSCNGCSLKVVIMPRNREEEMAAAA